MECWSKPPSSVIKIHLATRVWLIVFRVSVTISASLVKSRRRIMFKNKTLPWKTHKSKFVAFFVLIGMAFSFIYEI